MYIRAVLIFLDQIHYFFLLRTTNIDPIFFIICIDDMPNFIHNQQISFLLIVLHVHSEDHSI